MNIQKRDHYYIIEEKSARRITIKNSVTVALTDGLQAVAVRLSHGAHGKQANVRIARLIFDADAFTKEQAEHYYQTHTFSYYDVNINGDKLVREAENIVHISDHEVIMVIRNGAIKDRTLNEQLYDQVSDHSLKCGELYAIYESSVQKDGDVIAGISRFDEAVKDIRSSDEDLLAVYDDVVTRGTQNKELSDQITEMEKQGSRLFTLMDESASDQPLNLSLIKFHTYSQHAQENINAIVDFIDSLIGNYGEVSLSVTYGEEQFYLEDSYQDEKIDHLYHLAQMRGAISAMYENDGGAIVCQSVRKAPDKYYGFAAKEGSLVTISPANLKWAMSQPADGGSLKKNKDEYLEAPITLDASVVQGS